MKKISFVFSAFAIVALIAATSDAGSVRFGGDVDSSGTPGGNLSGGVIQVIMDLNAEDNLLNGGIDFAVTAGTPGVIQFDSASITAGTWTIQSAAVADANRVNLNTSSILAGGLPLGGQNQVIATINYSVLNPAGSTALGYVLPAEAAIVDGRNFGTDVTANYEFQPGNVTFIPEPSTIALAGLSLIGLVLRRRNG